MHQLKSGSTEPRYTRRRQPQGGGRIFRSSLFCVPHFGRNRSSLQWMHNRRAPRTGVLRSHSSRASLACLLFPFDPQCRTPPRRSTRSTSSLLRRSLLPGTNEKDKPNWDASVLTLKYIFNPATGVYTNKMRIGVRAKAGLKDVGGLMRSVVGSISLGGHHVRIASSFVRPP